MTLRGLVRRVERDLGPPLANISFLAMRRGIRAVQRGGVSMMHTARPFSYYRKVFYDGRTARDVLDSLRGLRVVDVGCGYTPYADDSMFRACHDAGVEFYGVDPLLGNAPRFGVRERALARATGGSGRFSQRAPGLERALASGAQAMPFADNSVDEILCSFLLFVWITDQTQLAAILEEFRRILKPGGRVKLYPLYEWRFLVVHSVPLRAVLTAFSVSQRFVHGGGDLRVTPAMLTLMTKLKVAS